MDEYEQGQRVIVDSEGFDKQDVWYVLDMVDSWPDGVLVCSDDTEDVRLVPTWKVVKV